MEELLNVVVSDPIDFDEFLFSKWLKGKTPDESLHQAMENYTESSKSVSLKSGISYKKRANSDSSDDLDQIDPQLVELLRYDILDQYRTFEILEHYLCQPSLLTRQTMLQIPVSTQLWIIETYYQIDDIIAREILSKKMTKNRTDLDAVCEITKLPLRRVTRQFDNLKRISNAIEERQCNILQFIESQFNLPTYLARKYSCLVFLIHGRFNIISKKRMQRVPCTKLELCAAITMACLVPDKNTFYSYWKYDDGMTQDEMFVSSPTNIGDDNPPWSTIWRLVGKVESVEPDKQLLRTLQDIRAHLSGDAMDSACAYLRSALLTSTNINTAAALSSPGAPSSYQTPPLGSGLGSDSGTGVPGVYRDSMSHTSNAPPPSPSMSGGIILRKLEAGGSQHIRHVLKALVMLGSNLSQSREYRDLFEDIMTKIGETLEEDGLTLMESCTFLRCCSGALVALEGSRVSLRLGDMKKEWQRFIRCCHLCLIQLFST
eukprot:gene9960-20711_t